jgi:hypothetical protein
MQKSGLRERGIYALPDGREFVVHAVFRGGYVLYLPGAWEFFGLHAYESDKDGMLRLNAKPTCWHLEDLIDTKRTAHSRSKSGAAFDTNKG